MNTLKKALCLCMLVSVSSSVIAKERPLDIETASSTLSSNDFVFDQALYSAQGLPEDQRYEAYINLMKKTKDSNLKALIYVKISELYLGINDRIEALSQLEMAVKTAPNNEAIVAKFDALQEEIYPTPSLLQKVRESNGANHLFMDFSLGLEYANNVIQESVNPATATNKEDTAILFNGFVSWSPEEKVFSLDQSLNYSLAVYNYFDHDELNLISNNLEYHLQNQKSLSGGSLSLDRSLAFSQVHYDQSALLWTAKLGFSGIYACNSGLTFNSGLSFTNTDYFDSAFSTEEGWGWNFDFGVSGMLDKDQKQNLRADFNYLGEDLDAGTSSYDEFGLRLTYSYAFKEMALKSLAPYVGLKTRSYDAILTGSTEERKDDRWEVGIDAVISMMENHRWTATLSTLENDSNIAANHYRNTQVTVQYGISL